MLRNNWSCHCLLYSICLKGFAMVDCLGYKGKHWKIPLRQIEESNNASTVKWKIAFCRLRITLLEHHKVRAKTTISIISDPLKSVGRIYLLLFPSKNLWTSQTSQHSLWKLLHSLKGLCSGILYKEHLNVNVQESKKINILCDHPLLCQSVFLTQAQKLV